MGSVVIREPKVIVVEGIEEVVFVTAMLNYLNLRQIQVLPYQGKYQLRPFLNALK